METLQTKEMIRVPWYEKLKDTVFELCVLEELEDCGLTADEAEEKFEEWSKADIFSSQTQVSDGIYSIRYYIMSEVDKLKKSVS